jgi:hypothetical protein
MGAFMPTTIVGTDFLDGDTLLIELSDGQAVIYSLAQLRSLKPIQSANYDSLYPAGETD